MAPSGCRASAAARASRVPNAVATAPPVPKSGSGVPSSSRRAAMNCSMPLGIRTAKPATTILPSGCSTIACARARTPTSSLTNPLPATSGRGHRSGRAARPSSLAGARTRIPPRGCAPGRRSRSRRPRRRRSRARARASARRPSRRSDRARRRPPTRRAASSPRRRRRPAARRAASGRPDDGDGTRHPFEKSRRRLHEILQREQRATRVSGRGPSPTSTSAVTAETAAAVRRASGTGSTRSRRPGGAASPARAACRRHRC